MSSTGLNTVQAATAQAAQNEVAIFFTVEGETRLIEKGESGWWMAHAPRLRQCQFVIFTQAAHKALAMGKDEDWATFATKTPAAHGTAFLIGKIAGVVTVPEDGNPKKFRQVVKISAYASVNVPGFWQAAKAGKGMRNPLCYATIQEVQALGIDPLSLTYTAITPPTPPKLKLTILEARQGLAAGLNVPESAVEITIRT